MIRASVVIPHYEDADRLRRCLTGLASSPPETLSATEVVVVDNASATDLSWVEAEFPFARLVVEPTPGAAPTRNRGVAETGHSRIAFLDCDCVPEPGWLGHVHNLDFDEDRDVIGGHISTFEETPPPRSGAEAFEAVFAFDQRSYIEDKGFSVTANMVFGRALFELAGPLRSGVSEDVEWCHRARDHGARIVYDPQLAVGHPTRSDWPSLRKKWLRTTTEAYGTSQANKVGWLVKAAMMPVSAVLHAPKLLASRNLNGMGERLSGAATLFRLRLMRGWWMLLLALGRKPT